MEKKLKLTKNGHLRITKDLTVYVDVDNTLAEARENGERALYKSISLVKQLHEKGFELYCWSEAGAVYAKQMCTWLGVANLFKAFLPKPDLLLDDRPWSDWCNQWIDARKVNESL